MFSDTSDCDTSDKKEETNVLNIGFLLSRAALHTCFISLAFSSSHLWTAHYNRPAVFMEHWYYTLTENPWFCDISFFSKWCIERRTSLKGQNCLWKLHTVIAILLLWKSHFNRRAMPPKFKYAERNPQC